MTIVYTGQMPRYSIERPVRVQFDRGVPTYCPKIVFDKLPSSSFTKYDSTLACTGGRPILVRMGPGLEPFMMGLPALNAILAAFPTSPIQVLSSRDFAPLLPPRTRIVESTKAGIADQFYREYDLTYGTRTKSALGPIHLVTTPWARLALIANGLAEAAFEWGSCLPSSARPAGVVIILGGKTLGTTWDELASALRREFPTATFIDTYDLARLADHARAIQSAAYYVAAGDSELNYVAGFSAMPGMAFLPDGLPTRISIVQWPNKQLKYSSQSGDVDSICKTLSQLIQGVPNESPRPHQPSEAGDGSDRGPNSIDSNSDGTGDNAERKADSPATTRRSRNNRQRGRRVGDPETGDSGEGSEDAGDENSVDPVADDSPVG